MSGDKCAMCGKGLTFLFPGDGSARRLVHDDAEATDVCAPVVPVIPAGAESGCIPHGESGCERCLQLLTRHSMQVEADGERGRAPIGLLVGLLLVTVLSVSLACIWGALKALGLL